MRVDDSRSEYYIFEWLLPHQLWCSASWPSSRNKNQQAFGWIDNRVPLNFNTVNGALAALTIGTQPRQPQAQTEASPDDFPPAPHRCQALVALASTQVADYYYCLARL